MQQSRTGSCVGGNELSDKLGGASEFRNNDTTENQAGDLAELGYGDDSSGAGGGQRATGIGHRGIHAGGRCTEGSKSG